MAVNDRSMASDERALDRKIDSAAWGAFFLWVGVALLANLGWGVGLIGAGLITIGGQAWRKHVGVNVDRFSLIIGATFAVVGVGILLELRVNVVPLLFIAAGVGLLASAWRSHRAPGRRGGVDAPPHPRV